MASNSTPNKKPEDTPDNLAAINDIGKVFEEALIAAGIRTYAQLARFTPDELSAFLKDKANLSVSASRIDKNEWIGQAQVLASTKTNQHAISDKPVMHPETGKGDAARSEWNTQAEFMLVFESRPDSDGKPTWQTHIWKTRIRDVECDKEIVIDGVQPVAWTNWIIEHAQLADEVGFFPDILSERKERSREEEETPKSARGFEDALDMHEKHAASDRIWLTIQAVEVDEDLSLPAEKRTEAVAMVRFQVVEESEGAALCAGGNYQIEAFLVDLQENLFRSVARKRGELQDSTSEYSVQLPFAKPEVGRYAVEGEVSILLPIELSATLRSETFRVVSA